MTGSSYVFEGGEQQPQELEQQDTIKKNSSKRQVAGRDYTHESTCLVCWDGGSVILCDRCPCAYHPACLGYDEKDAKAITSSVWSCPHHQVFNPIHPFPLSTAPRVSLLNFIGSFPFSPSICGYVSNNLCFLAYI